jgi:hypothetical protein
MVLNLKDRQGARSCSAAFDPAARHRGGRITAGYVGLWHRAGLTCPAPKGTHLKARTRITRSSVLPVVRCTL